jgi:hypothetical protein
MAEKDRGTCHYGLLTSPEKITCWRDKFWTYYRHRSFGEHCSDRKERKEGKPYFDYNRTDDGLREKEGD